MDEVLKNYKECSTEEFNRAMDFVDKGVPSRVTPTELLYIIFTKYAYSVSRLFVLDAGRSCYKYTDYVRDNRIKLSALKELVRRGYNCKGVKVS